MNNENGYYKRLKEEHAELSGRISALSFFINVAPRYKELSTNHKRLLCLQLEFMKAYLLILDLRIEDIEKGSADNEIHK